MGTDATGASLCERQERGRAVTRFLARVQIGSTSQGPLSRLHVLHEQPTVSGTVRARSSYTEVDTYTIRPRGLCGIGANPPTEVSVSPL